jgi:hypothetical protein
MFEALFDDVELLRCGHRLRVGVRTQGGAALALVYVV